MNTTRRRFLAGSTIATSFAALGLTTQVVSAQGSNMLRARISRDMEVLDPAYMIGGQEMAIQYAIMPRLVELDLSGDAVSWKPTEFVSRIEIVSPTRIEFELKKGLMWTNGFGELTAEDVAYSYTRQLEGDWAKRFTTMESIEVTGSHSGAITLKHPYAPFMTTTLCTGVGTVVCKEAVEALEEKKYTLTVPASCGPYYISEHVQRQKLVLSPNPDWTGAPPDFQEIQCIVVESGSAGELAFEAGEVDITKIESASIPRYQDNPPANSGILVAGNLQYAWVGMNTEHPKLQDVRVRKAIQRAIDIEKVQQIAFKGVAATANGIIPPGILGRREAPGYSYDPEAARALLAEAGVEGLELNIVTINKNRERLLAAQVMQQNLADVGVTLNILPLESGQFWGHGREKKGDAWQDSQLWIMRFGGNVDPADYFQWFISAQKGNWNWERWTNEEFDALYETAIASTDEAERKSIYLKMQEMMEETGAYVWINHEPEVFLYSKLIEPSVDPTGVYLFRSTNPVA
ncbi:MAG: ABC transporter substrate-binding protein [Boseongicola sp.]